MNLEAFALYLLVILSGYQFQSSAWTVGTAQNLYINMALMYIFQSSYKNSDVDLKIPIL